MRMTDQAKATLLQIVENWQGILVFVFVINLFAPTLLVVWMLAQQGGYVESGVGFQHNEIYKKVSGNQVLLSGLYYQDFAKCMQNAAKDATENGWRLERMESACREADSRMVRHMASLGVEMTEWKRAKEQ